MAIEVMDDDFSIADSVLMIVLLSPEIFHG